MLRRCKNLKPCPHCRRNVRLLQKSATVVENGETTAKFGDCRTFLRQCGQGFNRRGARNGEWVSESIDQSIKISQSVLWSRMTFDDFCRYFVSLAVCQRINTSPLSLEKSFNELLIHGEWALPHRVGGCINNRRTFLNNPQVCLQPVAVLGKKYLGSYRL